MTTAQPSDAAPRAFFLTSLTPSLAYGVFAAAVCVLQWPTLARMGEMWLSSSSHHHGFLVAPIALWMIGAGPAASHQARLWPMAGVGVFSAAGLWLIGRAGGIDLFEQLAFVSLLIAGAALFYGRERARLWAFPLAFLFFMVPFGETILPALQVVAAKGCVFLLNVFGLNATLDGALITSPGGRFLVAEACAGLNFLLAAVMIAAVFSWRGFASWRGRLGFLAFAAAFAVFANILRAAAVVALANVAGGVYSIAADHIVLGWVFYAVLLFALVAVGRKFGDVPPQNERPQTRPEKPAASIGLPVALIAALVFLSAISGYNRLVVTKTPVAFASRALPPLSVKGWRMLPPDPLWRPGFDQADRNLHVAYASNGATIQTSIAYFAYDRPGAEIAGYGSRHYESADWREVGKRDKLILVFGAPRSVAIKTFENAAGARLDAASLYWLGDRVFTDAASLKRVQIAQRLFGRASSGGVIVIAASHDESAKPIRAFLIDVEPFNNWRERIGAGNAD